MPTVRLLDGREVDSASEEWRHECEARTVLAMPSIEARRGFLGVVETRRGLEARQALETTIRAIWNKRRADAGLA